MKSGRIRINSGCFATRNAGMFWSDSSRWRDRQTLTRFLESLDEPA